MTMQINAQRVKHLREQKCWSQQQLADMAGISLRTIQRLEAKFQEQLRVQWEWAFY